MDIVEKLRRINGPVAIQYDDPDYDYEIAWQAADEIERLREEIKMLKNKPRENLRPDDGFGGSPMQYDFNKRR